MVTSKYTGSNPVALFGDVTLDGSSKPFIKFLPLFI